MKRLDLAVIGQGRSGKDIHGAYYLSKDNEFFNVKYVVDEDVNRRELVKNLYDGATVLSSYTELFDKNVDVVVNATYSDEHYAVCKDLLNHGFNVLTEKPFAQNAYECDDLIKTAKDNGVKLAVFQQTFYAPFYRYAKKIIKDGILGEIKQISVFYNNFARRWDWQTLQKRMGGNAYNTGPHPIGMALGFMDFDKNAKVAYSKMSSADLFAGDADAYCKIILDAPEKPVLDVEINNTDAFSPFNIKIQGTKGTFKCTPKKYEMKYIADGENDIKTVSDKFIYGENYEPVYCKETLIAHESAGDFDGDAFGVGTALLYKDLYYYITENKPMHVTPEMAKAVISVIEEVHAHNPMEVKF